MAKLGEVCEVLDSKRVPITAANRVSGQHPYYGANGVQDYVADYIFDDELVLLAEDGGNFGSKEKPIAYRVSGKCWVNNHAHVLKPKAVIDVDYLCYSLMFYDVSGLVNGATRQKLTQSDMRKMEIPLRTMVEQKKIVCRLNKLTELISLRKQQLAKLDELVKARFVEMFGDPVSNPKHWKTAFLLDIGYCKNGMNFHKGDSGVEIHCLGVGDFKNRTMIQNVEDLPFVSLNELPNPEYLLRDNDIIFVRSNGNKELVGRCLAIYPGSIPVTYSGFCIRYRLTSTNIDTPYLLQVLKTDSIRKKMTGRGANIQNLNQQTLSQLLVPIPPLSLQNEFAAFVERVDQQKQTVQQSLEKLELMKKALMQEYFG